jgi:hypothetical protein
MSQAIHSPRTDVAVHRKMEAIFGPSSERLNVQAAGSSRRSDDVVSPVAPARRRFEIASIAAVLSAILVLSAAASVAVLSLRHPEAAASKRGLAKSGDYPRASNDELPLPTAQLPRNDTGSIGRPAAVAPSGEATVRAFYAALGRGDGRKASALIVPEKRTSRAFAAAEMSRFYGGLPQRIRLTRISPSSSRSFLVGYRYSASSSPCVGEAIVTIADRENQNLIVAIRALNGC